MDLIIDFVGKNYFNQDIDVLNRDGTVVYLAFLSGPVFDKVNFGPVLYKRLTLKGSTLRSRDLEYQSNLLGQFEKNALPQIYDGKMVIAVHEVFPWTEVQKAQKEMQENKNSGKVSRGSCCYSARKLISRLSLRSPRCKKSGAYQVNALDEEVSAE